MGEKIKEEAFKLTKNYNSPPIQLEAIIADKGIRLLPYDLGDNISGVLIIENGQATIGYNKNEHRVRNRFTIAHELGHFILHKGQDLFVDKEFKLMFRSTPGEGDNVTHEKEANEFAANVLMPENLLRDAMATLDLDYTDENSIKLLARKFDVSAVAMSIRLSILGFLSPK